MASLSQLAAAATLGVTLATTPAPADAGKSIKLSPSIAQKVRGLFGSSPKNSPSKEGVILGASTGTRVAHGIYASMSLAQLAALDEKRMDDMAYQYFLSEREKAEQTGNLLDPGKDLTAKRVQQIARTITQAIKKSMHKGRYEEIRDQISEGTGWKILTVQNPSLNAYCLPGGRMVVYSGLAEKLSDDELAVVIAHEIMHAMKGHSYNAAKESLMRRAALYAGAAAVVGVKALPISMAALGEAFTSATVFSRGREQEADISGLHIARDAGYDPNAAITLWRKMDQLNGAQNPPELLSSHPSHVNRKEYLMEEIRRMGR